TIKQISVFLENKPGALRKMIDTLADKNINLRSLTLVESQDFGLARIITDDPYNTSTVLREEGYVTSIVPVFAVEMPDEPGGLTSVLGVLSDNDININYLYAFTGSTKNAAYVVLRIEEIEKAKSVFISNGIKPLCSEELL
ncbi:MAG: acetolactate synthase, partial [Clostridia bacterium]|nr:acetolactate synthase [Clostridia bacterium]